MKCRGAGKAQVFGANLRHRGEEGARPAVLVLLKARVAYHALASRAQEYGGEATSEVELALGS